MSDKIMSAGFSQLDVSWS